MEGPRDSHLFGRRPVQFSVGGRRRLRRRSTAVAVSVALVAAGAELRSRAGGAGDATGGLCELDAGAAQHADLFDRGYLHGHRAGRNNLGRDRRRRRRRRRRLSGPALRRRQCRRRRTARSRSPRAPVYLVRHRRCRWPGRPPTTSAYGGNGSGVFALDSIARPHRQARRSPVPAAAAPITATAATPARPERPTTSPPATAEVRQSAPLAAPAASPSGIDAAPRVAAPPARAMTRLRRLSPLGGAGGSAVQQQRAAAAAAVTAAAAAALGPASTIGSAGTEPAAAAVHRSRPPI